VSRVGGSPGGSFPRGAGGARPARTVREVSIAAPSGEEPVAHVERSPIQGSSGRPEIFIEVPLGCSEPPPEPSSRFVTLPSGLSSGVDMCINDRDDDPRKRVEGAGDERRGSGRLRHARGARTERGQDRVEGIRMAIGEPRPEMGSDELTGAQFGGAYLKTTR